MKNTLKILPFFLIAIMLASTPLSAWGGTISLNHLGTYQPENTPLDEGVSEIVAYDDLSESVFVINAFNATVSSIDISDPANPSLNFIINVTSFVGINGGVNSVDVKDGLVAIAVENETKSNPGMVAFYDNTGSPINSVGVGVLPDAVVFSPDGMTVISSNEGEPNGSDPKGSISIIDVSGGVASASVTTLDFTGFDGKEETLRNKGVLVEQGKSVSVDFEPEYAAFSPDGNQAFVTLQEANAFAVVDLEGPEIVDILPLGFKDHSTGQPHLSLFPFSNLNFLGTDANGNKIKLGGFSALAFKEQINKNKLSFITVPDRGPNGAEVVAGNRTFNLPDYQARIIQFDVMLNNQKSSVKHDQTILLTRDGGIPITGLPNIPGFDEQPVDAAGNPVSYDPFGGDLEGVVVDPLDGTYWMVDEYRPSIYHFDTNGVLINRLVPDGTSMLSPASDQAAALGVDIGDIVPGFYGDETLPSVYNYHRSNRGFEGIALDNENRILYAFIQSPMDNPNHSNNPTVLRILGVDIDGVSPDYLHPVSEYVQFLELSSVNDGAVDKIGDAIYIGDGKFLSLERDSSINPEAKKFIFELDLKNATNTLYSAISNATSYPTLEQIDGSTSQSVDSLRDTYGIEPVNKRKILNLPSIGYLPSDKAEGIAVLPDGTIAVLNDNDFGIEEATGLEPVLGLITFDDGNKLDASDDDGEINIQHWPVLGAYQPDGLTSFIVDGKTFYITANEGDAREDARIKDVDLDDDVFPEESELIEEENLGRLHIIPNFGDLDSDGDYDQLYSFGARSFTIWDSLGNLVFDSSDQLEEITADLIPDYFNSNNDDNDSFDKRSDDKGPEPESVVVGQVGAQTLAFVGLERVGGVMVYDVTDPTNPVFLTYENHRDFTEDVEDGDFVNPDAGDLGPEGLEFVSAEDSPTGNPLIIVGNEISGTTSIFEVTAIP